MATPLPQPDEANTWRESVWKKLMGEWRAEHGGFKGHSLVLTAEGLLVDGLLNYNFSVRIGSSWVWACYDDHDGTFYRANIITMVDLKSGKLSEGGVQEMDWSLISAGKSKKAFKWTRFEIETVSCFILGPCSMVKFGCYQNEEALPRVCTRQEAAIPVHIVDDDFVTLRPLARNMGSMNIDEALRASQGIACAADLIGKGTRWRAIHASIPVRMFDGHPKQAPAKAEDVECQRTVPLGGVVIQAGKPFDGGQFVPIVPCGLVDITMFERMPPCVPSKMSDISFTPEQLLSCPVCDSYFEHPSTYSRLWEYRECPLFLACSSCHLPIDRSLEWPCLICRSSRHDRCWYIICTSCAPPDRPMDKFPRRTPPYKRLKSA